MGALENIKANMTAKATKQAEPSLLDKALSFFGVGKPAVAPDPNASALQNIKTKLGTAPAAPAVAPAAAPSTFKIDPTKIPKTPPLFASPMATTQVVVENKPPVTLADIFKKSADIVTAVPKALIQSELQPSPQEIELEKAFNTAPDASNFEKVINYVPSILAKGVFRFFQPIFQPYADDLSQAIVSQELAPQVASGAIPYSAFEEMFPALKKSNAQVLGDSIQAGLAVYMPNVFAKSVAGAASIGVKSALAEGLKTGAVSGGIFGSAQVLSSGSTDPAEIADIFAKNIIGGALLGAVTHAAVPLSKESVAKMTKDITTKYDLPTELYIDAAKVREVFNPSSGKPVDGVRVKVSPAERDIISSLGLDEAAYKKAANEGVSISVPATKIVQITDKPWFGQIKDTFGFKPSEHTITTKGEPTIVRTVRPEPKVSRETAPKPSPEGSPTPEAPKPTPTPEVAPDAPVEVPVPKPSKGQYPTIHEGGVVKMVKGEPVKIMEGVDTFAHKGDGGWIVSEASTGRFIAESASKEGAIAKAKFNIGEAGTEKFLELLKNHKLPETAKTKSQLEIPTAKKTQKEIVAAEVAKNGEAKIKDIAKATKILEPNVRRILGVGAKEGTFERVGDGVYKLSKGGKEIAFVQTANAIEALPKLAKEGFKADMVFLDIPYDNGAVRGGNRGVKFDLISTSEFKTVMKAVGEIVRDEHTPVLYMFSQAVSGVKQMEKYNAEVVAAGFKPIARGDYQKLFQNGLPVTNVRGKVAQPEGIILFTKSGKFAKADVNLNFKLTRPKGYSTEKPEAMLRALIKDTTKKGETVLDPFAGSGSTGAAAIKEGRKPYLIERSKDVVEKVIKPRIKEASKEVAVAKDETPAPVVEAEQKTSGVAKSIEAEAIKKGLTEGFTDLAGYDPATVVEQTQKVADLITGDMKKVNDILSGKEKLQSDIRGAMFIRGVEEYAQVTGDVALLQKLASSELVSETSLHASELRLLQEREPESPVKMIREVQKAREAAAEKTTGTTLNKAKTAIAENIKTEVKKAKPTRQSWEEFVKSIEC